MCVCMYIYRSAHRMLFVLVANNKLHKRMSIVCNLSDRNDDTMSDVRMNIRPARATWNLGHRCIYRSTTC